MNTEVSTLWKSMPAKEQIEATDDVVEALKKQQEAKALAPHYVPLHAFHDTHANLESVKKEVSFFP